MILTRQIVDLKRVGKLTKFLTGLPYENRTFMS